MKAHVTIDEDSLIIMSYSLTDSNVHESVEFEELWNNLHDNVTPLRSLADNPYTSNEILEVVREGGATPYHGIKKNAICKKHPNDRF